MATLVSPSACRLAVLGVMLVAVAGPVRHVGAAEVPFVTLAEGSFAGPVSGRLIVIRTPEKFARVWAVMNAGTVPAPPAPVVDFNASMVLIAARGYKPTCGYFVRIERVEPTDHGLEVTLRTWRETCATPVVTYWNHVVLVPRDDGRVKAVVIRGFPET